MHSVPPTIVWMPLSPSTHAIGVGQPSPPTTAAAASRSIFWFVNAGPPPGNTPSICTRRRTFLATSRRPSSLLPCPGGRREETGEVREAADGDDRHRVVGLAGEEAPVEHGDRARRVGTAVDRAFEPLHHLVGVAVRERAGIATGHVAHREIGVAVRGVDRVDRGHRHRVGHVRHDAEQPDVPEPVELVRDPDRGGVVPPPRQVGVEDHAGRGPTPPCLRRRGGRHHDDEEPHRHEDARRRSRAHAPIVAGFAPTVPRDSPGGCPGRPGPRPGPRAWSRRPRRSRCCPLLPPP